ncbi:hypothetical protein KUTeg_020495 [Tegillarca granosa]|uniref:SLC41A/MgtE integral membrane domain-containing protein n=1 Tax=Tegillarca granosa TaxID=220873 RepID=A0ABQ9E821_TEGGR|nr:hypothetical protein KUTeg_020495 [Tegillarca granosa]
MASEGSIGYGLRSRKKMVPYIPDTHANQSKPMSSADLPAHGSSNGASVIPEECELQEIQRENGIVKSVNVPSTGAEEEETLFDRTSDTQPLLGGESSGDDEVKIETEDLKTIIEKSESSFAIALQVFFPYIIAGFGTVGAGMVLDVVQHWEVFQTVSEVFILVPSLLGLKGNLEMTLASRLSTQAHLGKMEDPGEKWKMIGGNLALVQAQAIVVGFLASMVAMIMGWIPEGKFNVHHGLLLCASSSIMVLVIVLSRKLKINPDNVATPIAASLGDLTTLSLLAAVSLVLYKAIGKQLWLAPTIIGIFVLLTPLWMYISVKNKYTNHVIYQGWTPVLSAMVISSIGGLILDYTVANYHGIAVFQPVINGVGGNLVAVQASRITTSLHLVSKPGKLPKNALNGCPNAFGAFCGKGMNPRAARVLMALVIPGHLIFMYTISYMKAGHTTITPLFALVYLTAAVLQVLILLYLAHWMVHFVWRLGDDPDNVAIPYLTAIGDLLGTAFLAVAFHILYLLGDKDADISSSRQENI